jgi:DNA-binding MarR family transcriptional regulator
MSDAAELAIELERLIAALVREGGRVGWIEKHQLSPRERVALSALVDGGPQRLGALAEAMETTDATATRTVQALEREGMVSRSPDLADARGVVIEATQEGRQLIDRGRRNTAKLFERLIEGVPHEDCRRLIALLREVTGAFAR